MEAVGEAGPDLLDYTVRSLSYLLFPAGGEQGERGEEVREVEEKVEELRLVLGLRCLSVLR